MQAKKGDAQPYHRRTLRIGRGAFDGPYACDIQLGYSVDPESMKNVPQDGTMNLLLPTDLRRETLKQFCSINSPFLK